MTAPGFVGADPEQLDGLAERFDRAAESLEAIRSTVGGTLGRVRWEGRDGDQLRDEWRGRHHAVIVAACEALRGAATALRTNAAQQRGASGSSGGSSSTQAGLPGTVAPSLGDALRGWIVGSQQVVSGGQSLIYLGDLLGKISKDAVLVGNLSQDFDSLVKFAGKFEGVQALDGLAIGLDVLKVVSEYSSGDLNGWTLFQLARDTASLIPVVGAINGAWEVGHFIGESAANFLQEQTHYQDAITNSIIADRYDGPMTPAQADDLVERYSGWTSYAHITQDIVTSQAHTAVESVKSLWNKVF